MPTFIFWYRLIKLRRATFRKGFSPVLLLEANGITVIVAIGFGYSNPCVRSL